MTNHDRRRKWRRGGTRDVRVYQLLNFRFDSSALLTVGSATRWLAEATRIALVNLVKHEISLADVGVALSKDIEVLVDKG